MTKNRLLDLVPPLELCKQIPAGKFEDSALVYIAGGIVVPRYIKLGDTEHFNNGTPAPTLEEIMDELARLELCPGIDLIVNIKGEVCGSINAACRAVSFCGGSATAALRLWLDVEGVKDER